MSVEAITWALKQRIKPSSAKFVLVSLANCADGAEFIAFPSVAYLAEATDQDRKTVNNGLNILRERGYIEDTGERRGSTKQIVVYRLRALEIGDLQAAQKRNTSDNGPVKEAQERNTSENGTLPKTDGKRPVFPGKEARFSPERGPKTGHGTVREPSKNRKGNVSGGAGAPGVPENPEQTKPNPKPGAASAGKLPAALGVRELVAEGVDRQHAQDWLKVRKEKRQPLTATAWELVKSEAEKAEITVAEAVRISTENSWAGFRASWMDKAKDGNGGAGGAGGDDLAWLASWSGIVDKGERLGVRQAAGESAPDFKLRVLAAANLTGEQTARARADFGVRL